MNEDTNNIKLITAGDRTTFNKFYDQYATVVFNTALSYTQNENDAEEITQDVFISVYRNATSFKGKSSIKTWLYRITINTSLNFIKKKKRDSKYSVKVDNLERPDFDHPGVILENKENARILFQLIDTLSENQKTAFILSFVEGLPQKEVSEIMGLSLKAVESLLQRGKKNLKVKIENSFPNRRNIT